MADKIVMSKDNVRRLQKDIIDIIKNPLTDNGIYYAHDDSNMLKGYAMVFGPSDTIYRFGAYIFEFNFPTNYPYSPPKLKYMTNDGVTRFHPNLYRNGKVCISILNTWKGEQWTSCQTIRSILLMLVTLLHNKPLLNEPGVKETSPSFVPYNKIITFKNLEIAILRNVTKKSENMYNDIINTLLIYHKKHVDKHKKEILEYIGELKKTTKNKIVKTGIYSMSIPINYKNLLDNFNDYFNKTK
tara:strand:+ start:7733 stop:8458 length:726 start_codon:yes stop_codon:yes gene_type:complete